MEVVVVVVEGEQEKVPIMVEGVIILIRTEWVDRLISLPRGPAPAPDMEGEEDLEEEVVEEEGGEMVIRGEIRNELLYRSSFPERDIAGACESRMISR